MVSNLQQFAVYLTLFIPEVYPFCCSHYQSLISSADNISLCEYTTTYYTATHFVVDGHLGCFYFV